MWLEQVFAHGFSHSQAIETVNQYRETRGFGFFKRISHRETPPDW